MLEQILRQSFGKLAHIAHHVQETYYRDAMHSHDNPQRMPTVNNIVSLTTAFFERNIPTFATAIIEEWDDDGSVHPDIKKLAEDTSLLGRSRSLVLPSGQGIEASAYSYSFKPKLMQFPVHILSGYNAGSCVLDTAMACLTDKKATLIVPADCIANAWLEKDGTDGKTKALKTMADNGAIISSMDEILTTMDKVCPALVK